MERRRFVQVGLGALAGLAAPGRLLAGAAAPAGSTRVAFCSANLVARVSGYRFQLSQWMDQHRRTVAATDEAEWRRICEEVAEAGFEAIEVWEAHASPERLDKAKAAAWRRALDDNGLEPVAYAGGLRRETLEICRWLGIPHVDGGLGELTPALATELCAEHGIGFNLENHPEKSAQEILAKIGGGNEWLGVCVDTGWLGTQGAPGPATIEACGALVRHVHVKDVAAAGGHATVLLGTGVADVEGCLATLRRIGYSGVYSWEDEPEDRNPMESAERNRRFIEERLAG
jgi:L-ribulose-5-phosphate 3-epimerase